MNIKDNFETFRFNGNDNLVNVLLLHGLGGNPAEMKELGRYINSKGFNVYCKRYAGHGARLDEFYKTNVNLWYKDAKEAYKELDQGKNKTIVCGLSMGGSFALKLSQEFKVKGLITMNAPVFGFDDEMIEMLVNKELSKYSVDNSKYHDIMIKVKKEYSDYIDELGESTNLKKIKANALIIQGLKDYNRFIESSEIIMNTISSKNKEIVHFKNSSHVITLDIEKKEVFKTVLDFVLKTNGDKNDNT